MKTNLNFNSAICTSREQSERLLKLGLNTETADMGLIGDIPIVLATTWTNADPMFDTPAWSLHRLIEMIPTRVPDISGIMHDLTVDGASISYYYFGEESYEIWRIWNDKELYDNVIDCIKWLIGEGHFDKEYLEE